MGTVTFGVDAGASGVASKNYTVTNANLGRLVNWSKANLFPQPSPDNPNPPVPTNVEAIEAWCDFMMGRTREFVQNWERKMANVDFPVG